MAGKLKLVESGETDTDPHAKCRALAQVLDRIGDKWTIMVVGVLSNGPLRFNALMRRIGGVSHRMLTLTLRSLERNGLIKRTVYTTTPPMVEYELTPLGHSLKKPLAALAEWGEENRTRIESAQTRFEGKESG